MDLGHTFFNWCVEVLVNIGKITGMGYELANIVIFVIIQPLSKRITNLIPPNVRQFGYDLFGGEQDFTEKDLSPDYQEELKGIANTALMKGKDTINYEDYEQGTMDQSLIKNLMSKNYNLKTLIGDGKIIY